MNKQYIGVFISRQGNIAGEVKTWFRSENREMFDWVVENVKKQWKLEVSSILFTTWDNLFISDVWILYEDNKDAVLHKLRWE